MYEMPFLGEITGTGIKGDRIHHRRSYAWDYCHGLPHDKTGFYGLLHVTDYHISHSSANFEDSYGF